MSKRKMSFDKEEASNSRERKLARRNPNQEEEEETPIQEEAADPNPEEEAPIQEEEEADPNPEEEEEAPNEEEGEADPNPEEEGQIPAQDLLFEKTLTYSEATGSGSQLRITGAHRDTLMAFLTDAEREILAETDGGLLVGTRIANGNGNGVEYALELKRNKKTFFNGWAEVARANRVRMGDSVQGFGSRVAGEFRLRLNIVKK